MGKMKATLSGAASAVIADPSSAVTQPVEPALVVFGRDEAKKAHASWFSAADAELAIKAAGLMRMTVLRVVSPEHRAAALTLAPGRVFESGKGFVPFCKEAAYEALHAFEGAFTPPPPVEPQAEPPLVATSTPATWDAIGAGSLVLASSAPGDGWWEVIITEAKGDGLFVCRWRDFLDEPSFVRRAEGLALLPPGNVENTARTA